MGEHAGRILEGIQVILHRLETLLPDDPFLELGTDPAFVQAILLEVNRAGQSLERVAELPGVAVSFRNRGAMAATQGALRQLREFLVELAVEPGGSVGNTRRARGQLAEAQVVLGRLMALLGVAAGPDLLDESPPLPSTPPQPDLELPNLAKRLADGFEKEEMIDVAFKLGFNVKHLAEGRSRYAMARELVEYMDSRGQLPALVKQAKLERPHLFP